MPIFRSNIKSIILLVVFCLSTFLVFGNAHAEDSECTQLTDKKSKIEKKVAELEAENESIVDTIIDIVKSVIGYAEPVNVSLSGSAKDLEKVKDVIEEVNGDLDTAGGLIGKFKKDSEGLLAALKESQAALKTVVTRTEQVRKIVAKTAKRLEKAIENTKKALHWVAEIRLLMKESDAARLSHGKELVATLCGVLDAAEVGSKAIIPLAHITQMCKGLTGILEDLVFINATMLKRNQQLIDAGVKFDLYPHALSDKPQEDPKRAARIKKIRELNQELKEINQDIDKACDPLTRAYEVARTYCNKQAGLNKLSSEYDDAQKRADKAREEFDQRWKDVPSTEEIDRAISKLEADKTNNEQKIKGLLRQMQSARGPRLNAIADRIRPLQEGNRHIDELLKKLKGQKKSAPKRDSSAEHLAELEREACLKKVEYNNAKCKWNECMKEKLRFEATNGVRWGNKSLTKKQIEALIKAVYKNKLYGKCKEMNPEDCEGKMVKVSAPTMVIPADGGPAYNVSVDTGEVPESQAQPPGVQVPPGTPVPPGTQTPASATFTPGQAQPTQPGLLTPPTGASQAQPSVGVSRDKCEPELPKKYQECASGVSKSKQELQTLQQKLRQAKADLKTNKDELRKAMDPNAWTA